MARADKLERKVHTENLLDLAGNHRTVGVQDVRIVFFSLMEKDVTVNLIVEERLGSEMLAETVVGEEDAPVSRPVCEHRVRPVEHGRLDECEGAAGKFQFVPGLDIHKVPVLMIVAADDGLPLFRAVDGGVGNLPHQFRQGAAVVGLVVVHDYAVDG